MVLASPTAGPKRRTVFGSMKGMLSSAQEKALLEAIEAPLPGDRPASFQLAALMGVSGRCCALPAPDGLFLFSF